MILGCEGLADYHCGLQSLEVPVSSGTSRLRQATCSFAAHVGSKCGRWKAEDWCKAGALSSDETGIFSDNALVNSPDNKEQVIDNSSGFCPDDSEGIALYIDLPCSPCKDSAESAYIKSPEQFLLAEGPKGGTSGTALPTGSHEQLKMTTSSQAEVSQRSDSKISSNLSSHVARSLLETDNVPRFKRWRQVTAFDQNPESASYMLKKSEILPNLRMSTSPVKEGLVESVPGRDVKAELDESDFMKDSGGDQHRSCCQEGSPCLIVDKTEAKIPSNLGTHGLRALMETEDVQKLKRRRLTTPADSAFVNKSIDVLDGNPSDFVSRQSSDLPLAKDTECSEESLPSPDSDGLWVRRTSAQSDIAQSTMDNAGSGDCTSEIASSLKGKSDTDSDSSESPSHSHDRETLDKYITRPPRYSSGGTTAASCPKKKEWLGQHHGGNNGETGAQDTSFAGNVGKLFRSAIDRRCPAAAHPGFVGDGANVQLCRVCGKREDATSSLICDSCEQVFHMACINIRMKIIPRVDEWLCRACKRKRKMCRESENQGDSDVGGEPKDWWREESFIGRVERELVRMSNGRRMKVRLGPKFQAGVPEWTGKDEEVDLDDNLAETSYRFGEEIPLTSEVKRLEQETAEYNLANVWNILPKGWLPAIQLPPGSEENWIQCTLLLFDQGEICPDGSTAEKDIFCGKWRRAPVGIIPDDQWECSCALLWDPRHADCAVPQELSTIEIEERMKSSKLIVQEKRASV